MSILYLFSALFFLSFLPYTTKGAPCPCPANNGTYCSAAVCTNCLAGYYGSSAGLATSTCNGLCSAGYYGATAGLNVATCTGGCLLGYYGISTTVRTTPTCDGLCACGTYGSAVAQTSSSCSGQCSPGRYGLATSVRTAATCDGPCSAGYYCLVGSCTATAALCNAGFYGSTTGLGVATCTGQCSQGYYGLSSTVRTTATCDGLCSGGYYGSTTGLSTATCTGQCSIGYYGSPATVRTTPTCDGLCSGGYYGSSTGQTMASCSGPCSMGYYGLSTTVRTTPTCDGLCSAGYYGSTTGLSVATCTGQCLQGYYGLATTVRTTPTCDGKCSCGTYGAAAGLSVATCTGQCSPGYFGSANTVRTTAMCDGKCSAGYYCPVGSCSATEIQCPAGKYSDEGAPACTDCSLGHYCLAGATISTQVPCPNGTYGGTMGLSNSSCSGRCSLGFFGGLGETTSNCSGLCHPGADCTSVSDTTPLSGAVQIYGTNSPTLSPYSSRTPFPSTSPLPSSTQSSTLSPSTSASYSVSATTQPTISPTPSAVSCQVGYYCGFDSTKGYSQTKCPAGRYGNTTQLSDSQCSGPCPEGFWCPSGTWYPQYFPCPPGTMCPEGSAQPSECSPGYACEGYRAVNITANATAQCSPGYYCPSSACNQTTLAPLPCVHNGADPYALNNSWCPRVDGCATSNCSSSLSQCPASGLLGAVTVTQVACPAGTYQPDKMKSDPSACLPCSKGTYSFNPGWAYPLCLGQCLAGKYGTVLGATTEAQACTFCSPGYFSPVAASSACQVCSLGTFAATNGTSICSLCPAGRYSFTSASKDSNDCVPCPIGTYGPNAGQGISGCLPCPKGTAGSFAGQVNVSMGCQACPEGLYTASTGTPSITQCSVLPVPCPSGFQPKSPPFATRASDCIPIVCQPPLTLKSTNFTGGGGGSAPSTMVGCLGCPPGKVGLLLPPLGGGGGGAVQGGAPDDSLCRLCNSSALCPGFLSGPLTPPDLALAGSGCLIGDALVKSIPLGPVAPVDNFFAVLASSTALVGTGSILLGAIVVILLVIVVNTRQRRKTAASAAAKGASKLLSSEGTNLPPSLPPSETSCWGRLKRALRCIDMFAMAHKVSSEPGNDVPRFRQTLFGGLLTLVAVATLIVVALYYTLSFVSFQNVISTTFLAYMDSDPTTGTTALFAPVPWLSTIAVPSLPAFTEMRVRVLAQGDPGKCSAPLNFSSSNEQGSWLLELGSGSASGSSSRGIGITSAVQTPLNYTALSSFPSTCDGLPGVSAFTFYCKDCAFTADATATLSLSLKFIMHYSCQALILEALAAGPAPRDRMSLVAPVAGVTRMTAPLEKTTGSATRGLLQGVNMTCNVLLGVVIDNRGSAGGGQWGGGGGVNGVSNITGKGYLLSGVATSSAFVDASIFSDSAANAYFFPATSAVDVRVTFVLDSVYSVTTAALRVNASSLFVSLISLMALFGAFAKLFACTEDYFCRKKRAAAAAAVAAAAVGKGEGLRGVRESGDDEWKGVKKGDSPLVGGARYTSGKASMRDLLNGVAVLQPSSPQSTSDSSFETNSPLVSTEKRGYISAAIGSATGTFPAKETPSFAPAPPDFIMEKAVAEPVSFSSRTTNPLENPTLSSSRSVTAASSFSYSSPITFTQSSFKSGSLKTADSFHHIKFTKSGNGQEKDSGAITSSRDILFTKPGVEGDDGDSGANTFSTRAISPAFPLFPTTFAGAPAIPTFNDFNISAAAAAANSPVASPVPAASTSPVATAAASNSYAASATFPATSPAASPAIAAAAAGGTTYFPSLYPEVPFSSLASFPPSFLDSFPPPSASAISPVFRPRVQGSATLLSSTTSEGYSPKGWGGGDEGFSVANPLGVGRGEGRAEGPPVQVRHSSRTLDKLAKEGFKELDYLR